MVTHHVKLSLEVLNCTMGFGGIATIAYGVLMFRGWQLGERSSSHHVTVPWFFHAFLGVGIALCAITCLGHIAANSSNICWLSTEYMLIALTSQLSQYITTLLLLLILETLVMASAFINPNWKKELQVKLSDEYDDFMDFVGSYDYIWKWIAGLIFLIQAVCVLLATLRIHRTNEIDSHENEDEDPEPTLPLLRPSARWTPADPHIV